MVGFTGGRTVPVPDFLEPLHGYRVWFVSPEPLRLLSLCLTVWPPFEALEARHSSNFLSTGWCPGPPCSGRSSGVTPRCGIFAFNSLARALECFRPYDTWRGTIVGEVALWGRFVRHEHGYRAQYAYPTNFLHAHNCDLAAVAAAYGIPCSEEDVCKSEKSWPAALPNRSMILFHRRLNQLRQRRTLWERILGDRSRIRKEG